MDDESGEPMEPMEEGKEEVPLIELGEAELERLASFQEACCCCSDYSSQIISYQTITADLL